MNELEIGDFVVSTAGHDFGKNYVIFQMDDEYVYLVDGKIRRMSHPKKKKIKHMKKIDYLDLSLADCIKNKTVRDEEIKRCMKLWLRGYSSKEVK